MKAKNKFILGILITSVTFLTITMFGTSSMKLNASKINVVTTSAKSNSESLNDLQQEKFAIHNNIVISQKSQSAISQKKMDELEDKLKSYIGVDIANIGLTYYDLESGNKVQINSDKEFLAASTVKVPMNMVLFDMVKDNKISINDTIAYDEDSDYEGGTGILEASDLESPISIKTLSDYSILYSDNIETNMLIRKIGIDNLKDCIETKIGHKIDRSDNFTTASDSAELLKLLYENPTNNPYYNNIIDNMKHTIFHDRIDKYLPGNITAHKIGNYENYVNDIAIVYSDHPYVLTIFTNDVPDANDKIAQISKIIYNYQLNNR